MVAGTMTAGCAASVFQRHRAPEPRAVVVVRQARRERVRLVHWSQEPTGLREVSGLGRESGDDRVVEPDAPKRVIQIPGHAKTRNPPEFRLHLHAVGLPFIETRIGVEPGIREEGGMWRV